MGKGIRPGRDQETIGGRSREDVRDLFRRRTLGAHTIDMHLGLLAKAEEFCRENGLSIDTLDAANLARFAATLHQSRPALSNARSALRHYWRATGRMDFPVLEVTELVGRPAKDPLEGFAAKERLSARGPASDGQVPTWVDRGYDRAWLLDLLLSRQLSRKTAVNYRTRLAHLARWSIEHGTTIDSLTAGELEAYADSLPHSRASRMMTRSAATHYFAAIRRPDPPLWAIRVPRRTRMLCRALEDDEARALEAAALRRADRKGLAVILGLYLGLRRFEIAKLRWTDFRDGWLHVVGKGDVEASIPVHPVAIEYLERVPSGTPFVFPGRYGGSVNPTTVWGWVRQVSTEAGLEAVPTHILRHTALALGNDGTGDLRSVQDFARHAEPDTTAGYTRTTRRRLVAVSDAIGDWYRPQDEDMLGAGIEPGHEPPTLSFSELVVILEGRHAVGPWLELSNLLADRQGWQLEGLGDDSHGIRFAFQSGKLSASVVALTGGKGTSFHLDREVGPTAEDIVWWSFGDSASLGAVLSTFEEGGVPFPPTGSFVLEDQEGVPTF